MNSLNRLFTLLFVLVLSASSFAQNELDIVLTVGDENVTKTDFESIFRKNNRDSVVTAAALDEYMELFINFKLKVKEAREEGLDTNASFIRELQGYRTQLARPYLIDNELLDELIQEAYKRTGEEVRASHILIKCDANAQPEDTVRAHNRINELRKRIIGGEDFTTVAKSKGGSEDPSVRDNDGDLGYFTAFQMVYPFENAAFKSEAGEISPIIRTRYGFHILNITDKRAARGEVKVSHIMIRNKDTKDPVAMKETETKAREIHQKLIDGSDFSELAMRFSQDASTSKSGGELPWFGTGKMVEEFEDASFALTENGQISEPIESSYGWHIIKRLDYRPVPSFEEVEVDLRKKVSRDSRSELTKRSFLNKLRTEYGAQPNKKALKLIYKAAQDDSAFVNGNGIEISKLSKLEKELFSIDGNVHTAKDYYNYLNSITIRKRDLNGNQIVDEKLEAYLDRELLAYEDSKLESKYNDFRLLMNEYHDGILLFELTDRKVWSKAVKDSVGLVNFYESNKNEFMWKERAAATVYTCANAKIAKQLKKLLKKGKTDAEIRTELNKDSSLNLSTESGTWERSKNDLLEKAQWETGLSSNIEHNGQIVVINFTEILAPTPKQLNEAKGMITAEYQNFLEQEWIKGLRSKYSYKANPSVLHSIK